MSLSEKDRTHDLQACPFCGCHGLSFAWPREFRGRMVAIIECHTDNCYALLTADGPDKAVAAWNRRAEGVAALQQVGEPDGWVLVPKEPTEEMRLACWRQQYVFHGATPTEAATLADQRANDRAGYEAMIAAAPLPQQTALVEGVEKIIAQHEPAACGEGTLPSPSPQAEPSHPTSAWIFEQAKSLSSDKDQDSVFALAWNLTVAFRRWANRSDGGEG